MVQQKQQPKQKILKEVPTMADHRALQSPSNQRRQFFDGGIGKNGIAVYQNNYMTQAGMQQSNSECLTRKMKGKVKFEPVLNPNQRQQQIQPNTNSKQQFKSSFDDQATSSPFEIIYNQPLLACKEAIGDLNSKPHRPSLGYGSSPQASSSSSKYYFSSSNRSSNLSTKQQQDPCIIQTKCQSSSSNTALLRANTLKVNAKSGNGVPRKFDKLVCNPWRQSQQRQSPNGAKKISLNIAEEKQHANQKQAIAETPKFNEYYSLLGRNQTKQQTQQQTHLPHQPSRSKSHNKENDKPKPIHTVTVSLQEKQEFPQQNESSNLIKANKALKYEQHRLFLQSHSSCSQRARDEMLTPLTESITGSKPRNGSSLGQSLDVRDHSSGAYAIVGDALLELDIIRKLNESRGSGTGQLVGKGLKPTIKLRRTDIKFQIEQRVNVKAGSQSEEQLLFSKKLTGSELVKLQPSQLVEKHKKITDNAEKLNPYRDSCGKQSAVKMRDGLRIEIQAQQWGSNRPGAGVMMGSPKIQQKQQQSKNEVEISVLNSQDSSFNTEANADTSIKNELATESQNNIGGATYQFYLNGGSCSLDNRNSSGFAKEKARYQVLKKSQAELVAKKKIKKKSGYLQDVVNLLANKDGNQKVSNKQSFNNPIVLQVNIASLESNKLTSSLKDGAQSSASTHREMLTRRAPSREGTASYSNAKKEFLTISDEKNKSHCSGGQNSDEHMSILNNSNCMLSHNINSARLQEPKTLVGKSISDKPTNEMRDAARRTEDIIFLSQIEQIQLDCDFNPHQTIVEDFSAQKPSAGVMKQANQFSYLGHDPLSCENSTVQTIESAGESKGIQKLSEQMKHTFGETSSLTGLAGVIDIAGSLKTTPRISKTQSKVLITSQTDFRFVLDYLDILELHRLIIIFRGRFLNAKERSRVLQQINSSILYRVNAVPQIVQYWQRIFEKDHMDQWRDVYRSLSSIHSKCDAIIENDLERTFHDTPLVKGSPVYLQLLRILRGVAAYYPDVGYVQGFNFIAAKLLSVLKNEELVFRMFAVILKFHRLFTMYTDHMPLIHSLQFQLSCFVQNFLPDIQLVFNKHSIMVEYFCQRWFICLFSCEFPKDFFALFINQMLLLGPQLLIQAPLAMLETIRDDLRRARNQEVVMSLITERMPHRIDSKKLLERAVIGFDQVTSERMKELEVIYCSVKKDKRVLFVKDEETEQTILKTLPNLPEDEIMTECNVDEDDSDGNHYENLYQDHMNNQLLLDSIFDNVDPSKPKTNFQTRPQSQQKIQSKKFSGAIREEPQHSPSINRINSMNKRTINDSFHINNNYQSMEQIGSRPESQISNAASRKPDSLQPDLDCHEIQVQLIAEQTLEQDFKEYQTNVRQSSEATKMLRMMNSNAYLESDGIIAINHPQLIEGEIFQTMHQNMVSIGHAAPSTQNTIKHMFDYQAEEEADGQLVTQIRTFHGERTRKVSTTDYQSLEQARQHQQQMKLQPDDILKTMSQRRFIHSPSLDNLKTSFKLMQKRKSKVSLVLTPNSEDVIESEHKVNDSSRQKKIDYNFRFIGSNLMQKQHHLDQLLLTEDFNDETGNSQNISNIEEFIHDLEYCTVQDKFQNTQRVTKDMRDDLTERDSVKVSRAQQQRPLTRELQLQFEISKLGSHLNTPNFQQTNRSTAILQEKKINHPISQAFDFKKTTLASQIVQHSIPIVSSKQQQPQQRPSENLDPNTLGSDIDELRMPRTLNQLTLKQTSDDFKQLQQLNKPVNNFQRFAQTQKNPLFRNSKKQQEAKKNKVIHNWSANNHKESFEFIQPLKQAIAEEVIKQMKLDGKSSATRQALNKVLNNNGLAGGMFTTRDDRSSNGAPLSYRGSRGQSNLCWEQEYQSKGPVLSPRAQPSNKQSQKLVVHQGDNFFEEGEMTTIVTPKEGLGKTRVNLKENPSRK